MPIEQGRLILGESRYTLVRTVRRSEHDAVLMHKLRVVDLADAPPLEQAVELLLELLERPHPGVSHSRRLSGASWRRCSRSCECACRQRSTPRFSAACWLQQRDGTAPPPTVARDAR